MNFKIMIADDDDDDVKILKEVLAEVLDKEQQVYSLHIAKNGLELMKDLEKEIDLPHILFLDINMPFRDGFVCLQEIKASDRLKHITVIMLSTSTFHTEIRKAYEWGAALYIPKATDYNNFRSNIENCLTVYQEAKMLN